MSDETKAALAEAIRAHVADEQPDHIPVTWMLMSQTVDITNPADLGSSYLLTSEGSVITQIGLVQAFMMRVQGSLW